MTPQVKGGGRGIGVVIAEESPQWGRPKVRPNWYTKQAACLEWRRPPLCSANVWKVYSHRATEHAQIPRQRNVPSCFLPNSVASAASPLMGTSRVSCHPTLFIIVLMGHLLGPACQRPQMQLRAQGRARGFRMPASLAQALLFGSARGSASQISTSRWAPGRDSTKLP